jgi:aminoglycoside phosphotransferase (APT) family kinase protein
MHPDEIHTDVALVRRLIATQFPQWSDQPVEPVAARGTDNAMYRLGDDLAVRLPRIGWASADVELEHQWLPRLAPHLPLAVPVPVAQGRPADGYPWPWSVQRWLPGDPASLDRIDDPARFADDLAAFVRALHAIDATGGPPATRGRPLLRRDAQTRQAIQTLSERSDWSDRLDAGAAIRIWEAALAAPDWAGPPVWIHADLTPGNLLVEDGRLSAVIDFGALGVGEPAADCIVAWNLLPPGPREVYRRALGVDEATWIRGRGWALSIALYALPYYLDLATNPGIVENSWHVIEQLVEEHRMAPAG